MEKIGINYSQQGYLRDVLKTTEKIGIYWRCTRGDGNLSKSTEIYWRCTRDDGKDRDLLEIYQSRWRFISRHFKDIIVDRICSIKFIGNDPDKMYYKKYHIRVDTGNDV